MTRTPDSLPAAYFDHVYAKHADPWNFESSPYEAEKYRRTLTSLGGRQFASALEIGCSIGVLTRMIAPSCDRLLAVDVSEAALEQARRRCADQPQVTFAQRRLPDEFPDGRFDLVLTSEVAYYWSAEDLQRATRQVEAALQPGGWWLLVHWTPEVADYPQTGDEVHDFVLARSGASGTLRHLSGFRQPTYRLDLFERAGAPDAD